MVAGYLTRPIRTGYHPVYARAHGASGGCPTRGGKDRFSRRWWKVVNVEMGLERTETSRDGEEGGAGCFSGAGLPVV